MKKITYFLLFGISFCLMIGSVSALWENLTPSAWSSYEDAFKTPELTHAWSYYQKEPFTSPIVTPSMWSSYEDAFTMPELTHAWSYYQKEPFTSPIVTPSMWSSYEDAFKTPELIHAWSYYYNTSIIRGS